MLMSSLDLKMAYIMNFHIANPSPLKTFMSPTFSLDFSIATKLYVNERSINYEKIIRSQIKEQSK